MILWGKQAQAVLDRLEALERELTRIITEDTEAKKSQPAGPVISARDEEGDVWLKRR